MSYQDHISQVSQLVQAKNGTWDGISPEYVARMRLQNRFTTGLDIAKYTAKIMREDMAAYDADPANYTQSLGCWHGFIAQQKLISIKKHFGTTKRRYIYLSGWMVAALRSEFGPLPDQSMHEKTSVPALIEEIYTFLRQADARELGMLFRDLDAARAAGDAAKQKEIQHKIDNYETHVVPIIADIDAGFGNAEATYLLAKKMIEAGACALQIENQVSDEKQCGHQDGKVTVPHEDFVQKIRALRYAFLELGVEDGVIVARTDSLGAGLTKQIAYSKEPGDIGDQYNAFLDCEEVQADAAHNGDVIINRGGKLLRPKRLPSNLFQFRPGTGADRCVLDCINALNNGADLLWIETEKPHVEQIASMMDRIREVWPNAKLAYNNSPSFNWTLNFRQQVYDAWKEAGKDVTPYDRAKLMSVDYDATPLALEADEKIRTFQRDAAKRAGIFHHLITLPTYHTAALSTDNLAKEYFGEQGMLGYVAGVQRKEIRQGIACVKHQNMSGSDIGDDHKEYFAGEAALKAGGVAQHDEPVRRLNSDRFENWAREQSRALFVSDAFEAREHIHRVDADLRHRVAAFHDEQCGFSERFDQCADLREMLVLQLEVRNWVVLVGVHAEGHDDNIRRIGGNSLDPLLQRVLVAGPLRAPVQRKIDVAAFAFASACLVGEAQHVRIFLVRVAMQRDEQRIAAVVEDLLRAVTVMVVDIENRDAPGAVIQQLLRGDGRVVEEAIAAEMVRRGMVPRRAAEREGGIRAGIEQRRAGQRDVHRGFDRLPAGRGDRRSAIEAVVAQAAVQRRRHAVRAHAPRRPGIGVGGAGAAHGRPLVMGSLQHLHQPWRMHAGDRLKWENLRRDDLAKPHLARPGQHQFRPLRLLEGRDKFAEQQLAWALVKEMVRAVDCFHAVDPSCSGVGTHHRRDGPCVQRGSGICGDGAGGRCLVDGLGLRGKKQVRREKFLKNDASVDASYRHLRVFCHIHAADQVVHRHGRLGSEFQLQA